MLTLVIPVYNGNVYIEQMWKELMCFCRSHDLVSHIVFVNDGSTDKTGDFLKKLNKEEFSGSFTILEYETNRGKGYALKKAILGDIETPYVAFTDVELPYGLDALALSVEHFQTHGEDSVVIGKRKDKQQYSTYRRFAKKCFRLLLPKALRGFDDTQSGFKVFRTQSAQKFFAKMKTHRWVFDLEILLAAKHTGVGIHELPLDIKKSCIENGAIRFSSHGFKILRDLINIRTYEKRGLYLDKKE